ncbi:MAG: hypothetical protein ACD_60C00019G0003 [uncultured bacterium]|nr:MAG: hypothetical protein ACD_60C00019G0003 [uncultured bacterium]
MTTSRKVFIYQGAGVGPLSTADLNSLFTTSKDIFPSRPDVTLRNFDFNMDDLTDPVFVVPGGSTSLIGNKLKSQMDKVKIHFKENFSYVGICAGAFLGAPDADLFVTTHRLSKENSKKFEPAKPFSSTKKLGIALNMIDDYQAFGAFYPDDSHLNAPPKELMPYRVTLSFVQSKRELSQLYIAGPAFIPSEEKQSSEIVATYVNHKNYTLYSNGKYQPNKPLTAIVRKQFEKKQGGIFLAATHIETCVPDSKLLTLFNQNSIKNAALDKEDYDLLIKEQKDTRTQIECLLQESLKLRS